MLHFVEDGEYSAYLVKGNDVEIGKHYEKVVTFNSVSYTHLMNPLPKK